MNNEYKISHKVRFSEVDSNYKMRLDHIITHFQDITGLHSNEMEIDGKTMLEKSNAFWVLTKIKLRIHDIPRFEDEVEIETWPTTAKGVRFGRDYNILKDGKPLVSCISEWCTLDFDTKRPRKVETVHYPHTMPHRADRSDAGEMLRFKESVSEEDFDHSYKIAFCDIDTNKHTNNSAYIRMTLNCFTPDEFEKISLSEVQISFVSQTFCGDEVKVYKKQTENGYYIEGRKGENCVFSALLIQK